MDIHRRLRYIVIVAQYGFLAYGVLFQDWSAYLVLLGCWVGAVADYIVAIASFFLSRCRGLAAAVFRYMFMYGFALFILSVFMIILAGMVARYDSFIINVLSAINDSDKAALVRSQLYSLLFVVIVPRVGALIIETMRGWGEARRECSDLPFQQQSLIRTHLLLLLGVGMHMLKLHHIFAVVIVIVAFALDFFNLGPSQATLREQMKNN